MASSHPQSRAQLLREMNKSRKSSTSSHHSQSPPASLSDFDPSQDAFMSTQPLDPSTTKLPELRASAQKYRRPSPPEPDYVIDTSAYERAFPDFTQGSMSSNSSISIELGRGTKKATRGTINKLSPSKDYSSNAGIDFDKESLDIQALSNDGDAVTVTPPFNSRPQKGRNMPSQSDGKNSNQPRKASNLRNQVEPSPPAKTLDYGSGDSRKSSDGTRRTLAAMHARVRDENDVSLTSTERPATVDTTTIRNTRFGNGKQPDKEPINALPSRFLSTSLFEPPLESSSAQILQRTDQQHEQSHHQDHQQNHQRGHQRDPQNQLQTHQQNHQQNRRRLSIENVPNMSEILSGVFEDGTPVFSRNTRARSVRNATDQGGRKVSQRSAVSEVDVPDDEQAIYLSLQLLQDKVSVLERSNAEAEYSVKELQQRNRELEAERLGGRRASHRSDSAIGMTDSDGGEEVAGASGRRSAIQRNRLEDSLRVLQAQADAASRKAATAETILRNITHERDSAVSQLSVAYVTVEQLKIDHEATKDENDRLRAQIQQLTETRGTDCPEMPSALVPPTTDAEPESRPKATPAEKGRSALLNKSNAAQQQLQVPKTRNPEKEEYPYDPLFDLSRKPDEGPLKHSGSISQSGSHENRQDGRHAEHQQPLQNEVREPAWSQTEGKKPEEGETRNSAEDMTYLSFVNGAEIARLRKTLEQERRDQHQRNMHRGPSALNASKATKDEGETAQIDADTRASRRSSLRDTAANPALSFKQDLPALAQESTGKQKRQHQEHSVLSTRSRGTNPENMTSAFIVPDITIRDPSAAVAEKEYAQPANNDRQHTKMIKQTTRIPKPIPVSQQMPEMNSEDDEPTMRPSQPPALALATVIKGLENEIGHLKTRLTKYQQVYNSHNPALSRRKRKAVYEKIDTLLHAIDTKSDQLYSLYDVLEGQKQSGHEMTQDYVDETLQSIGLDVTGLSLKDNDQDQTTTTRTKDRLPWDLGNEAAAHEDLPWEGIDV